MMVLMYASVPNLGANKILQQDFVMQQISRVMFDTFYCNKWQAIGVVFPNSFLQQIGSFMLDTIWL